MPWLHFLGAALVVAITAFFSAVHSPLGHEISAGESPGFAWIRANIIPCIGFALVYLILVCWLLIQQIRRARPALRMMSLLICIQVVGIALVTLLLFFQRTNSLSLVLTVLLISLLLQGADTFWRSGRFEYDRQSVVSQKGSANAGLFLVLLFVVGATISYLDPSWRRLSDQVFLDSDWEYNLRHLYPLVLSGAASVWFGIGMMIIIISFYLLQRKVGHRLGVNRVFDFLTFFSLVAAFSAFLLVTLYYAISWQINNLNLKYTVWQMFIFFSVAGGILFSAVFYRIVPHISVSKERSMIGLVALTIGATIVFPITWFLTSGRKKPFSWMLLLISTFGICLFIGYAVLFGDLFDPWFTAFSYLKGAILKLVSVVAAGTVVLMIEQHISFNSRVPSSFR